MSWLSKFRHASVRALTRRRATSLLSLSLWLLFLTAYAFPATTVEGFITNINSDTSFDVGTLHVVLDAKTHCKTERLLSSISLLHNTIFGGVPDHNSFVLHDHPAPSSEQSTSCDSLRWKVGTRVRVLGDSGTRAGAYLATQVTVYSVTIREDIPAVGSDHEWTGGALLEEKPQVSQAANGWAGTMWVDGYPASITPDTSLLTGPSETQIAYGSSGFFGGSKMKAILPKGAVRPFSGTLFQPNTWATYRGVGVVDGRLLLNRLRLWPNRLEPKENEYWARLAPIIRDPDYPHHIPGSVIFVDANPGEDLTVLADQKAQDFVSKLGASLVPQYQAALPETDKTKIHFRFYVVQSVGKTLDNEVKRLGGPPFLKRPSWDEAVVPLPDGLVIVPMQTLDRIDSEAQLASILSYAITSVLQKQSYTARPGIGTSLDAAVVAISQYEQALRIGIRQMYLAGYDIRDAPFAWAVAQGKPVNNPVIDSKHPDKEIPWYAAYAFNYISQYYQNVDYSKLKRGRAEYQQFLKELYKADPGLLRPRDTAPDPGAL